VPSQLRSGRPPATSHAAIESAAFALFEERGYEATTTEEIAERAGIGRRTLFRYFPAKADIPWGQFAEGLGRFRTALLAAPADEPIMTTIVREIIEFNTFPPEVMPSHRRRITLILTVPELQAHAALRHAEWRAVVAEFVARRTHTRITDHLPILISHVAHGMALSAYERWLMEADADLGVILRESSRLLADQLKQP
jgi:mycofactocin system transcriptional regulator